MNYRILFVYLLTWLVSCSKDEPINPSNSPICLNFVEQFDNDNCDLGVSYKKDLPFNEKACFNPRNPDEFVYCQGNTIFKYTISNQVSEIIKEEIRPFTQLDWGSSGWITYTGSDWNVWVLKEDGSDLRKLTNAPRDWGPEFNSYGDRITYSRRMEYSNYDLENHPELREKYKIMIITVDSTPVDSFCRRTGAENLCNPWDICSWSKDDQKFAVPENGIRIYDTDGNPLTGKLKDHDVIAHHDIEWHPFENVVYFTDNQGLKMVNISTEEFITIKESCDSKKYIDISISNDGKTILASREISTYSDCTVNRRMDLVLMDIDGNNERVVQIE